MTRSTCLRPFLGGMNISTWDVKISSPTRSLLLVAEKASKALMVAITSPFISDWLPNSPEEDASTTRITVCSRSSTNFLM